MPYPDLFRCSSIGGGERDHSPTLQQTFHDCALQLFRGDDTLRNRLPSMESCGYLHFKANFTRHEYTHDGTNRLQRKCNHHSQGLLTVFRHLFFSYRNFSSAAAVSVGMPGYLGTLALRERHTRSPIDSKFRKQKNQGNTHRSIFVEVHSVHRLCASWQSAHPHEADINGRTRSRHATFLPHHFSHELFQRPELLEFTKLCAQP